ncbi:MAG: lamin tail domain-containing protein [Nibricoccus sp.]
MPYYLIKGEAHIYYPDTPLQGPQPDGDTIKFKPDNPQLIERLTRLGGVPASFNKRQMVNCRFDAIDALELHYSGSHQQLSGASRARDTLLNMVGFGSVTYFPNHPLVPQSVERHPRRIHILANSIDAYGRVIAFVFAGDVPEIDGAQIFLGVDRVNDSTNVRLLRSGEVYPAFYASLPLDLRQHFGNVARAARTAGLSIWPDNVGTVEKPASVPTLAAAETLAIWPKLYRRLTTYFSSGHTGLAEFEQWLRADKTRDDALLLPNQQPGNLHDVIRITGDRISLLFPPEDLVIQEKGAASTPTPPPVPKQPASANALKIVAALVNPLGADAGKERVTLLNRSPEPISLNGWKLADKSNRRLPLTGTLAGGGIQQIALTTKLPLANTGDTISILDPSDQLVDQVSYTGQDAKREGWSLIF